MGNRDAAAAFPAGGRFELVRELGRGGMGVVYEVVDRERRVHLALKGVRKVGPHAVLRLKNEFRAVRDIQHENLVRLDELFERDGAWFFTMELIHGTTLMRWIRPDETEGALPTETATPPTRADGVAARWSREVVTETLEGLMPARSSEPRRGEGGTFDEARLRAALRGLVGGLVALHRAGIVHRDVKPSNVMVGDDGRIVLLDFGVVTEVTSDEARREVVGTYTYMAPEQVTAGEVGPAADWYAVGVVLFEAMTGDVPFAGKGALDAKVREEAPSPRTWSDALPEDLAALCERLLRRDPAERPGAEELLAFCGLDDGGDDVGFVGRADELARMRAAFDAPGPRAVFVTGESGIGKSALAARFVDELRRARPDVLVLRARCDQRELVSYNAFDGAVDALARHLALHPPASAPRGVGPLLRIFPALRSVAALDEAARTPVAVEDERSLAFAALAELLAATAARRPVVLLVDDIHWADADSLALLGEVFAGDAAPAVLLLATARLDPDGALPARAAVKVATEVITLGGLAPAEAEALVRAAAPGADAARLASETGGHPMFLAEIALRVGAAGSPAARLDDTLWQRITELDAGSRAVLEVVALGGAPLPVGAVPAAAGLGPEGFARALGAVRGARLIRVTGTRDHDVVEPYHDRVRETVVAHLDVGRRREVHRAIVTGLEESGAGVEVLAYHLAEAGDGARAAALAEAAARRALDALAFDRAAEWLRLTLELGALAPERRRALLIERADMLSRAGRTLEAADAFLAAAEGQPLEGSRELRRRAAEELLIGGHFLRGRALARELSAEIGVGVPQSTASAIAHLVWYGLRLRLSRLRWKTRAPDDVPLPDRMRLDHAWSLCTGFSMVDSMRGAVLAMRAPLLALRAADPGRLGRGLCAGATAAAGMGSRRLAERLRAAAHRAAEADPAAALYAAFADIAHAFYLDNDWPAALRACERSAALVPAGRGHTFEADVIEQHRVWTMSMLGDYRGLRRRVPQAIRSAQRIGNRFVEISFRTFFGNLHLMDDRPDDARADVDDAIAAWAVGDDEVTNPLFFAMKSRTWAALYQRRADDRAIDDGWRKIERSLLNRIPMIRLETSNFHAQIAIARGQLDAARRWSRRARRIGLPHAPRLADLLDAGIAIAAGDLDDAARRLPGMIERLEACHQRASAAAARWRLGQVLGGDEGAAHVAAAEAFFREQRVVRPERWIETILPAAGAS